MAQRLKRKAVKKVSRPKRITTRAKKPKKQILTDIPVAPTAEHFEVNGKLCPDGCCFNIVLARQDGKELSIADAQFGLHALGEIVKKHGLPPKAARELVAGVH